MRPSSASYAPTDCPPARYDELLGHLEDIILAEGFSHLRVGVLASRLRCSRTTLYQLAPTKEGLILLAIERYVDAMAQEASAAGADEALPYVERIFAYARVIHRWRDRASMQFWQDVAAWEPANRLFAARSRIESRRVADIFREAVECGAFREMNTTFVGEVVWRGTMATRDPDVLEASCLSSGDAMEELAALILRGVEHE